MFCSLENSAQEMQMFSALLAATQPDGFCHTLAVVQRYALGQAEEFQTCSAGHLEQRSSFLAQDFNRLFHMSFQTVQREWKSPLNAPSWKVL